MTAIVQISFEYVWSDEKLHESAREFAIASK